MLNIINTSEYNEINSRNTILEYLEGSSMIKAILSSKKNRK